jgi:hypothetical protein
MATSKPPHKNAPHLVSFFGLKSAISKTTAARAVIDFQLSRGQTVRGVSVDRNLKLPARYKGAVSPVLLPRATEIVDDPTSAILAFEPFQREVTAAIAGGHSLVCDIGSGEYPSAILQYFARTRFNAYAQRVGLRSTAVIMTTRDEVVMHDVPILSEAIKEVLPGTEIVVGLSEKAGKFVFGEGTEGLAVWTEHLKPLLSKHRSFVVPQIPGGAWDRFEEAGLRFIDVVRLDPDKPEHERQLMKWTRAGRDVAVALQGDVSEWMMLVWKSVQDILDVAGNASGGDSHGG